MRVVIDTNVLVAAARSNQGAAFAVLRLLRLRRFQPIVTQALWSEYEAVLHRPHLASGYLPQSIDKFLDAFLSLAIETQVYFLWRPHLPDAQDDCVLEAALAGMATLIVTHNVRHFPNIASLGIRVVTPETFLRMLRAT